MEIPISGYIVWIKLGVCFNNERLGLPCIYAMLFTTIVWKTILRKRKQKLKRRMNSATRLKRKDRRKGRGLVLISSLRVDY
jgi:hypothetical protein